MVSLGIPLIRKLLTEDVTVAGPSVIALGVGPSAAVLEVIII